MSAMPWKTKEQEGDGGPLSPLSTLRTEVERLFDSFMRDPRAVLDWPFGQRGWEPTVDVAENDQEVTVRAEVPGIKPEDLAVTVSGNQLVLAGEKKEGSEDKGKGYHRVESRYGSFRRSIALPEVVDQNQVEAEYANGVLTIHLKKSPAAAPKKIEVKSK
jgi:HSP20 family protein